MHCAVDGSADSVGPLQYSLAMPHQDYAALAILASHSNTPLKSFVMHFPHNSMEVHAMLALLDLLRCGNAKHHTTGMQRTTGWNTQMLKSGFAPRFMRATAVSCRISKLPFVLCMLWYALHPVHHLHSLARHDRFPYVASAFIWP